MNIDQLSREHCSRIDSASSQMTMEEADHLLGDLGGWKICSDDNEPRLEKTFKFADFKQALEFTKQVGRIADEEDHHPALCTEWGKVTVDWWTHKIKGLHRNDFIMAAKTEAAVAHSQQ